MFLRPRLRLPLRPRPLSRFTDCPPPPALRPLLARPYTAAATASSPKQLSCDQHDDLDSFMRYANDVDLPRETSVYVGTLYEYTVHRTLSHMGFNLTRVGGRNDRGVDLHGAWTPPTSRGLPVRAPLEVYVQCKVERCRAGPKYMRELEGTINATHTPLTPPIGILASTTPCTPGLRQHMMLSRLPLAYCCIEPHRRGGFLLQFLWNASVGDLIGRGVGVTTRYIPSSNSYGVDEIRREAVLTIDGHIIDFENAESPEEEEEGWEVANIV